jgi:pSer/pThr/pTyr-binding forkhead associated (FHA) protein
MPKFLLKFNAAVLREIPIDKTPLTIGRKPENDIVIDNMAVSGQHAKLVLQGGNYVIEDLQSTNGTFVNEKKIVNSAVKHNDHIMIGQHTLVFLYPESLQEKPAKTAAADETVVMTPERQAELLNMEAVVKAPSEPQARQAEQAVLRVIEGKSEQREYVLSSLLTYIGKSETAAIKIKGFFAPDIAALISKRPTGYIITAVKDGYSKLNGKSLSGQADLQDGDLIEAGGIKFLFQRKTPSQ